MSHSDLSPVGHVNQERPERSLVLRPFQLIDPHRSPHFRLGGVGLGTPGKGVTRPKPLNVPTAFARLILSDSVKSLFPSPPGVVARRAVNLYFSLPHARPALVKTGRSVVYAAGI